MGAPLRLGKAYRHPGARRARGRALPRADRKGSCHRVKLLPTILGNDEDGGPAVATRVGAASEPTPLPPLHWAWSVAVAAGAAIPRLLYLFVFSDPENPGVRRYGDVWHHWQIAYLTKEIGLSAPEGPRLWDLKGLDYFWGILHPLLMVA